MGIFVVKHRKLILLLAIILIIPAIIGFTSTRVNYDMLNYLPDSMDTVKGQHILLDEFKKGAFSIITEDLSEQEISELTNKIRQVDHVDSATSLGDLVNANLPAKPFPHLGATILTTTRTPSPSNSPSRQKVSNNQTTSKNFHSHSVYAKI